MRPLVFAAVMALSACAAAPRPACGCLPPAQPDMPLPTLSATDEAAIVIDALAFACLKEQAPTVFVRGAVQAGWLRQGTAGHGSEACVIEVNGPPARIRAVDDALLAWTTARELTWNVRDSNGLRDENGRRAVTRVRGEHGQDEPELSWRFVLADAGDEVTTLRLEWDPARTD